MSVKNIAAVSQNLDQHLTYPILEFLEKRGNDVAEAKKYIIGKTSRFSDALKLNAADEGKKNKIETSKTKFEAVYQKALDNSQKILEEFFQQNDEKEYRLKKASEIEQKRKDSSLTAQELYSGKKITQQMINALYELAFLSFDNGLYSQASDMLLLFVTIQGKKDDSNEISALWGKLVCDSLIGNFDEAAKGVAALRAEQQPPVPVTVVARSWLLHHSLFTYFKRPDASHLFLDDVIDFSTYMYANTIEVNSPHLIRYLAAAAILNRKRRSFLKRVIKIMEQEAYNHEDQFAKFLMAIGESDFERANDVIKTLAAEAEEDYFLADMKEELVNSAQMMVFDDYLKIHKTVSIPAVAEKLGMDNDKAEVWLVTLIQESKIEAEIDSVEKTITIQNATSGKAAAANSVHRSVLAKLENMSRPTN